MLTNAAHFKGFKIHAIDGELGTSHDLYFDDETWTVRYVVVSTGGWMDERQVLISPFSVLHVDWEAMRVNLSLTKAQVEKSPDIHKHQPVSRQHETEYLSYYGYPNYWGGPYSWGSEYYPMPLMMAPLALSDETAADKIRRESADSHLRSTKAVTGYGIHAADGTIGHVNGFIVDSESWAIRYIDVATRDWWPGKKVLVSPAWITRVSWSESSVYLWLSRETIQRAPEYVDDAPVSREYEQRLYAHYGTPPYWSIEERKHMLTASSV